MLILKPLSTPSLLPQLLLSAALPALGAAAAVVQQQQLFQLVVRVVQQPTQHAAFPIEGYYVSTQDFVSNARELLLIPKSGATSTDGVHIVPESFYTNTSQFTIRPAATTAEKTNPFLWYQDTMSYSPPGYSAQGLIEGYSGVRKGTRVYSYATGQPYFGQDPTNNYNSPDPGEGHWLACNFNSDSQPRVNIFCDNGSTAPANTTGPCANIRLLPQCAGNFTSGTAPKNVQLTSCYVDAASAPLPSLPD